MPEQIVRPSDTMKPWEQVPRDQWGRPRIIQADGSLIAYRRPSTLAKTLDDKEALKKWAMRQVAYGVSVRPDLVALAASHPGDKAQLDRAATMAMEAAASGAAANTGTALHKFLEDLDCGNESPHVPAELRSDIAAYVEARDGIGLEVVDCEQFVVNDEFLVAGTFDRLYRTRKGVLCIGDIKAGSDLAVKYGQIAFAIQMAFYARSKRYDPTTGERSELGCSQRYGLVVHLPARSGRCDLYQIDLEAGWELAMLALEVYETRKKKDLVKQLVVPK